MIRRDHLIYAMGGLPTPSHFLSALEWAAEQSDDEFLLSLCRNLRGTGHWSGGDPNRETDEGLRRSLAAEIAAGEMEIADEIGIPPEFLDGGAA